MDREKKQTKKTSLLLHQDVINLFTYDKTYFERIRWLQHRLTW